jgi:nucleoside-diphosphate-sugar epimerase
MASGLGGRDLTVDCTKAMTELGYKTIPLETMVRDCFDWLRAEHRI